MFLYTAVKSEYIAAFSIFTYKTIDNSKIR